MTDEQIISLWNDLPFEERTRLHPYLIHTHIRHLEQARAIAQDSYHRQIAAIDEVIKNLKGSLK